MNTNKRIPLENICFYNAEKDEGRTFLETFATVDNIENEVIFVDHFKKEHSKLRKQARRIVFLKYTGLTNNEVAEKLGVRASTVSMALKKFKSAVY